jgi:DNA primase
VIALHQAGIDNVVASSGTSLTQEQVKLISRYTPNITILYDGDEAGLKAAFRGIDLILGQGMNVRIVLFPEGEDPDSFARSRSRNEVREYIRTGARNFLLFKAQLLMKDAGKDPILRATMIKEMVSSIALIPDAISRSLHLKECSQLTGIPEQSLISEMNKTLRQQFRKDYIDIGSLEPVAMPQPSQMPVINQADSSFQEKNLLRILLNYGDKNFNVEKTDEQGRTTEVELNVAEFIIRDLEADQLEFDSRLHNAILAIFRDGVDRKELPAFRQFLNHEDSHIRECAIDLTASQYAVSEKWAKKHRIFIVNEEQQLRELVFESIYTFKLKKIEQMLAGLREQLKEARTDSEIDRLLKEQTILLSSKQHISRELGRIITH